MTIHSKGFIRARALSCTAAIALMGATAAGAVELDLMMSDVDGKADILREMAERYAADNPDVSFNFNLVGYNVIRDQLVLQMEAGTGPDIVMTTNIGTHSPFMVDLTPYVDAATWEDQYGAVLPWYRAGREEGIYGFHSEMTVTGPYVNLTMFEEAGVELPGDGATWEDWAEATRQVMENTGSYAGMVMDRSGHRMAGPAMSYGAQYFDDQNNLILDDGFRKFSQMMIDWHDEGLMPADVWPAQSGGKYANGNEMFFNQDVPFYMSGSWNTSNVQTNVGDKFDWAVVPVPCGPAGCGVMPGGAGIVALKTGDAESEEASAKFVAWMGEEEQAREWYTRTYAIPANSKLQDEGLDYASEGASEAVSEGLNAFTSMAGKAAEQTPQAYRLQGDPRNFVIFNATVQYISEAMNGVLTLDEAISKIEEELAANANN
jgi:alpha-1,4-digalacturonate transport system substrate-binding protein